MRIRSKEWRMVMQHGVYYFKQIQNEMELEDRETSFSSSKIDRIYCGSALDIGRFELKAGILFYIEPLGVMRSYYIVSGFCKNLKSGEYFRAGDMLVFDEFDELMTLHVEDDMVLLIHSEKNRVIESFRESNALLIQILNEIQDKDHYTKDHSIRVFKLVKQMAIARGYHSQRLFDINKAARFHDVGKIHVPDEVLNKPSKLNQPEFEIIKKHVSNSKDMISEYFNDNIYRIIEQHHERLDGSGYPKGLRADEILEESKILAICDSYDAMTTDRVYKAAKEHEEAIGELLEMAGSQYDAELVNLFIELFPQKPEL